MNHYRLASSLLFIIATGCYQSTVNESISFKPTESPDALTDKVKRIDLIPLQTKDTPLIGKDPELAVLPDGSFIIVNKEHNEVLHFGADGVFLNLVGRRGSGPGEYLEIRNVQIQGNEIIVFSQPDKLLRYSAAGSFIDEKQIGHQGTQSFCVPEGVLTYYSYGAGNGFRLGLLTGERISPFLPSAENVLHFSADTPVFFQYGDKVLFTDSYQPVIYEYEDRRIAQHAAFDFGSFSIGEKFYSFDNPFQAMEYLLSRKFALIRRYAESEHYQFVEVFVQSPESVKAFYGIAKEGNWQWFSAGEREKSPFFNSFRWLDKETLYCILDAYLLKEGESPFHNLFSDTEVLAGIAQEDNPVIAKIRLIP